MGVGVVIQGYAYWHILLLALCRGIAFGNVQGTNVVYGFEPALTICKVNSRNLSTDLILCVMSVPFITKLENWDELKN